MNSTKSVGRIVGVLLLLHFGASAAGFILLDRVRRSASFLENAAGSPGQMRAAVFLLFVASAMAIAIAIEALPVLRRYSSTIALWLLALAVAGFALQAVDNGALLSMLSLSQEHAKAGTAQMELFQALAVVAGLARKWSHYSYLLVFGGWIFLLYSLFFRFRLVPRALASFGLLASLGQIGGVTVRGLLGYAPMTLLAVPLAPAWVALAVWLMVRGFDERHRPLQAEAQGAEFGGLGRS